MLAEIKEFVKKHQADIILVIGVVLISLLSFALGYILAKNQEKPPLKFEQYETAKYSYYRSRDNGAVPCLETFGAGS